MVARLPEWLIRAGSVGKGDQRGRAEDKFKLPAFSERRQLRQRRKRVCCISIHLWICAKTTRCGSPSAGRAIDPAFTRLPHQRVPPFAARRLFATLASQRQYAYHYYVNFLADVPVYAEILKYNHNSGFAPNNPQACGTFRWVSFDCWTRHSITHGSRGFSYV